MTTFYTKFELARALGCDHRAIMRVGIMPDATAPDGRPLYELAHARQQWETYTANLKARKVTK
jgi:hypothetical protein